MEELAGGIRISQSIQKNIDRMAGACCFDMRCIEMAKLITYFCLLRLSTLLCVENQKKIIVYQVIVFQKRQPGEK